MSKPTEGPFKSWNAEDGSHVVAKFHEPSVGVEIVACFKSSFKGSDQKVDEANAYMFKQSSVYLEALKEMVDSCWCRSGGFEGGEFVRGSGEESINPCDRCAKARAIVADANAKKGE